MSQCCQEDIETGSVFMPKFDANGLLPAIVTHADHGGVLVVAFMNEEAIRKTRETGRVHFWSRSRKKLWLKGETSGHFLNVVEIKVDCDQDALWISANPDGPTCHRGVPSCFYRRLTDEGLEPL
ncbi:MAG: phosphoribosyl-AMP cyclohydrolase [Pseudomonadota bacterium]